MKRIDKAPFGNKCTNVGSWATETIGFIRV